MIVRSIVQLPSLVKLLHLQHVIRDVAGTRVVCRLVNHSRDAHIRTNNLIPTLAEVDEVLALNVDAALLGESLAGGADGTPRLNVVLLLRGPLPYVGHDAT